ncbi:nitrate/nitrite transporter [Thioflavicoccus mobilis 8321]|uniref:Nitrate/nitrite transporter n=1 Tax=Thioflavicoccus mobilis 8321 TaxID=765912 RepID=L0GV94_9GAMM|nr:MFS transporter [Thioflavicoccus mobilis]AGA89906.1 nitrate/nitrite transporter [Thioflavicoccus mobilis 8321]
MPYWRLASFYFFYFGSLGALMPYWGLYLQERGFSSLAIGQLVAILMATKIVAPNVWGWLADRQGRRMPIVRQASLLSALAFLAVFVADGLAQMALVMVLFSFFWNASLPQMEAVTFSHLGARVNRYASIRLWGSIGFIVAVGGLGVGRQYLGNELVPLVVLGLYAGVWLSALAVPEGKVVAHEEASPPITRLLRRREIQAFLVSALLMQMSHGAYYAFYSIYLEQAGYDSLAIGALWAWAVVIEVLVFLAMHRLLDDFGARRILLATFALAVLRWLLIGSFVAVPAVQILAQALHAATFGAFHAAAIHLAYHYFPGRTQGRGQALYNSASFGVGGGIGTLASGFLWTGVGATATFVASAGVAALGGLLVWRWVDRARRF